MVVVASTTLPAVQPGDSEKTAVSQENTAVSQENTGEFKDLLVKGTWGRGGGDGVIRKDM